MCSRGRVNCGGVCDFWLGLFDVVRKAGNLSLWADEACLVWRGRDQESWINNLFGSTPRNPRSSPHARSLTRRGIHCIHRCDQRTPANGDQRMPVGTGPPPSPVTGGRRLPADAESSLAQIEMEYRAGELTQRGYEIRRSRILSAPDIANLNLSGEQPPTSAGVSTTHHPYCDHCRRH